MSADEITTAGGGEFFEGGVAKNEKGGYVSESGYLETGLFIILVLANNHFKKRFIWG